MAATKIPKLAAKHPKHTKPKKPKVLVFGKSGVGKTYASLDFPDVYFCDTESGATLPHYTEKLEKANGLYLGQEDGANDYEFVVGQVMALATHKHDRRTLVIDSFTKLFDTAITIEYERLVAMGRDMSKSYGAEKKPSIARTRQLISWFDRLDMNVLLICHETPLWKDGDQVGETFSAWPRLEYELDLVLQVFKIGKSRKVRVRKSRLLQFEEGSVFDWGYLPFAEKFGKGIIEADVVSLPPSTPQQIDEIIHLSALVKLDDASRLKWWEKAGVEDWSEMDGGTIQKCIDHLKSTLSPV